MSKTRSKKKRNRSRIGPLRGDWWRLGCMHSRPAICVLPDVDRNYRRITLIFKKYGDYPLCLEKYALFSLPPIFTNNLFTYTLRYIIYLGQPSGNFNFKLPWHIYTHIHAKI